MAPDRKSHQETVRLSNDSNDEYQNPQDPEGTDLETDHDREPLVIADGAASRGRNLPQAADNCWMTVRISTTSG